MKSFSLVIAFAIVTIAPAPLLAQDARPRVQVSQANKPEAIDSASAVSLKHFDLDFPGGSPRELVAAISKAMGKPLNVVIPESNADVQIMPIKVSNVTVPELFRAIQTASAFEVPIVTATASNGPGGGRGKSIQFKSGSLSFRANTEPVTDDTIWAFQALGLPTEEFKAALQAAEEPNLICQYFQLAPHLENHTIEDITTAIQTGWKMLNVAPMPQLSFHKETKLLIAVGAKDQIEMIPQVLGQLQADNTVGLEKIAKLQAELAEIEEKDDSWITKAREKEEQISHLAALIRAREAVQNTPRVAPAPVIRKAGN